MKVIYHSDFVSKDLQERDAYYAVPACSYLEIVAGKSEQISDAFINGNRVTDIAKIDCPESAQITVSVNGGIKIFEVKAIAKLLLPEYSGVYGEFDYNFSKVQGATPLDSILDGKLRMYAVEQSAEVKDISETLKYIKGAYFAFKRVCDKPKSHLKAINEVKSIETVKRVGYESISYLAAHSEDWLAKTASGLKPARLFSRVEDDEFHIYENRFVKTVIDAICTYLKRNRDNLKDQVSQVRGILDSNVQTNAFGFDAGFDIAVKELIQDDKGGFDHRLKQLELAKKLLAETKALWKKYRDLISSRLYRYLKRAKPVINPINETNILLMDKNYNVVFKLWKEYPRLNTPQEIDKVNPENLAGQQKNYKLFCKTLCEYAAHTMKFAQEEEGKFFRESDSLQLLIKEEKGSIAVQVMSMQKHREFRLTGGLECPLENGEKFGSFEFLNQVLYWGNDTTDDEIRGLCNKLRTLEKEERSGELKTTQLRDRNKAEIAKEKALKKELLEKQKSYGVTEIYKIIILTSFIDIENETQNRFFDYMKDVSKSFEKECDYVVVAMPKCKIPEQRLTSYAKRYGEKALFLPLTMFDINSYRRLQNLFLRLIVKLGKGECPLCGSRMRGRECTSDDCRLMVTRTKCSNQRCKHEYIYCYNARQEDSIENISLIDANDFYLKDSIFQYRDIVELTAEGKIKPICPKCRT